MMGVSFGGSVVSQSQIASSAPVSRSELNAAIAAAIAVDGWLELRPDLSITLDAALAPITAGNLRIRGNGSTLVYTGADVTDVGVGATNSLHGALRYDVPGGTIEIHGLNIVRSPAPTSVGLMHGISIGRAAKAVIRGCELKNWYNCGAAIRRTPSIEIVDNDFSGNGYAGHTTCGGAVKILLNEYRSNGISGTGAGYNMAMATRQFSDEVACEPSTILGNIHIGVVRKAIDVHHGKGVMISGNHISGQVTETVSASSMIYAVAEAADKNVSDITVTGNTIDIDDSASLGSYGVYVGGAGAVTGLDNLGAFVVHGNTIKGPKTYGVFAGGTNDSTAGIVDSIKITENTIALGDGVGATGIGAGRGGGSSSSERLIDVSNNTISFGASAQAGIVLGGGGIVKCLGNISVSRSLTAAPWGLKTAAVNRLIIRDNDLFGPYQADYAASTLSKSGNYFSGIAD